MRATPLGETMPVTINSRAIAALLTMTFILVAGLAALRAAPATQASPAAQRVSACGMSVTGTLIAGTFDGCSGEVALSVEPSCPVCPGGINAVFIQHSKAPQQGWQNEQSASAFDAMVRMKSPETRLKIGVVHYDEASSRVVFDPSSGAIDESRMRDELKRTVAGYQPNALTIRDAARDGVRLMRKLGNDTPRGTVPCEFMVIFGYTKSHFLGMETAMLEAAKTLNSYTYFVGCPQIPGTEYCRNTRKMVRSLRDHTEHKDSGKLADMVRRTMSDFDDGAKARTLTLSQLIPPGLDLVTGGAATLDVVPEVEAVPEGTKLTWVWADSFELETREYTATYKVSTPGEATASYTLTGGAQLIDSKRAVLELPMPDLGITMSICVTPTPTPTDVPTSTPTEPPDTPVPTPTSTNTLTPTPSSYAIYLPIARLDPEECIPELIYADAVLVLDMSTSMYRETRSGRTKHEAAMAAARTFVEQLTFVGDALGRHDRVGIAGFNDNRVDRDRPDRRRRRDRFSDPVSSRADQRWDAPRFGASAGSGDPRCIGEDRRQQADSDPPDRRPAKSRSASPGNRAAGRNGAGCSDGGEGSRHARVYDRIGRSIRRSARAAGRGGVEC